MSSSIYRAEPLGEQANKELLCFQFEFEFWLQRDLGRKHVENVSSVSPRTFSQSQPKLERNCRARACLVGDEV